MSERNNEIIDSRNSSQIVETDPAESKNKHIRSALRKRKGRLTAQAYEEDQEAIFIIPFINLNAQNSL